MAVIKKEDLIGFRNEKGSDICLDCGDWGQAQPLTKDDFDETDIVKCDECGERIQ